MKTEDIENQDEQKWKSVNQLLSRAGSHLNILEEEIDVPFFESEVNAAFALA